MSIRESLSHAATYHHRKLRLKEILSDELTAENVAERLRGFQGVIIAPGFGGRGISGKLAAIQYARENNVPCLGICLGMQCMAIEFARNVLGLKDANSSEFDPDTKHNVVDIMEEQKTLTNKGATMRLGAYTCKLREESKVREIYGKECISERHRHRYEFNNHYREQFELNGMRCAGINADADLVEIIELTSYTEEEKVILTVRPGITGYNQAVNRNSVLTKEKLKNDIYYVKHLSLWFDIKIVFMTIATVLGHKNINRADVSTDNAYVLKKDGTKSSTEINK